MSLPNKRQTEIDQIRELLQKGIECWVQIGAIVAKMIDDDPEAIDRICEACPLLTAESVLNFERLGRKTLHPRLLISYGPGVNRLRKLPYHLQERYVTQPVELLLANGETLQCDVMNLTTQQAAQVFSSDGLRSLAAQRAWLEGEATKRVAPPSRIDLPYRITSGKLIILNACTLSRKELAKILVELE
jgi:hypothetical protein